MQNHWEALTRYASSGYLAIDNNVSEQHMKTIATGRKNWLFTGSEEGGKTMAILFSVVSSCQRHGHDPFVYLRDVLGRLPGLPKERLAELLPDRWSPAPASAATSEAVGPGGRLSRGRLPIRSMWGQAVLYEGAPASRGLALGDGSLQRLAMGPGEAVGVNLKGRRLISSPPPHAGGCDILLA